VQQQTPAGDGGGDPARSRRSRSTSAWANCYIDIVQPLPGQPQQIFLRFQDGFRVLNNPAPQAHQEIEQAFAFGHQVIGIWGQPDTGDPAQCPRAEALMRRL